MCVKLNSLFDSEIKVYYVTQVLKQGINIKTMCPTTNSNLETAFIQLPQVSATEPHMTVLFNFQYHFQYHVHTSLLTLTTESHVWMPM